MGNVVAVGVQEFLNHNVIVTTHVISRLIRVSTGKYGRLPQDLERVVMIIGPLLYYLKT